MRLSSLDKLNQLAKTFVDQDDKKLGRGEVDALAAFYGGLAPAEQAKIEPRLAELYQTSRFDRGQKAILLDRLTRAGVSAEKLEGVVGTGADAFAALGKVAQLHKLQELEGGAGFSKDITAGAIPPGARVKVEAGIERFQTDYEKKAHGEPPEFGDRTYHAIYLEEGANGRGKELVGFAVQLGIYHDDHDVDQMLFFNGKGQLLGNDYRGE